MDERSIDERLARLEERLSRLEQRLGEPPVESPPPLPSPPPPRPEDFSTVAWQESREPSPVPLASRATRPPAAAPRAEAVAGPPPIPKLLSDIAASARAIRAEPRGAETFEAQVGLKWAGWVGAIVVVIGAALGIKYAYDQNWFGALPAAARLALMSLGGFALLAAGEVVYRRVGALAAAGLFGAGVATLFVVSYAGYRYFELYDREAAFAFMALVTLVGAAVAIRGNLVSIATLSIVGGNVAPLALGTETPRLVPFLGYLLMLQVLALVLAWWGRTPKWWTLRGVALATLCLWMAVPVVDIESVPGQPRGTVLAFLLLYAVLFHLELVLTSARGPRPATTREPAFAVPVPLGARGGPPPEQTAVGVTFSLIVTTALTVGLLVLLRHRPDWQRGAWTIGLAGCCLGLGVLLPRIARGRDPLAPPSPLLALAVGYRIQAAALVVVAVPVVLAGVWISVAWAVLALALAVAGAALNLSVSRAAAVFVWTLAAIQLGLWTLGGATGAGGTAPTAPWAVVLGHPIPAYFVIAALLALVAHAIAALIREDWTAASAARQAPEAERAAPSDGDPTRAGGGGGAGTLNLNYESRSPVARRPMAAAGFHALASVADVMAVVVFVLAACVALPTAGLTAAMLGYGWVLIGLGYVVRSAELHPLGLVLICVAGFKWLIHDTLALGLAGPSTGRPGYQPVYNPVAAVGGGLLASAVALRFVPLHLPERLGLRRDGLGPEVTPARRAAAVRGVAGFAAVLVALWLVTTEVDRYFDVRAAVAATAAESDGFLRAKQTTISIVWSVYAVACVAAGFAAHVAGLRYFGLALFALTVGKVMVVDLQSLQTGYRILSFLGLGLLLLGTSVLYGKLSPLLLREPEPEPPITGAEDAAGAAPTESR